MHAKPALVLPVLLLSTLAASAQVFDFDSGRIPIASLSCPWRFHTGDDLRWADPTFDDSAWVLIRMDQSRSGEEHVDQAGISWYRLQVVPPRQPIQLALLVPEILDNYQIFANGELIGKIGGMPPNAQAMIARNMLFRIPESAVQPGRPLVLAIRVWRWSHMAPVSGGTQSPPILGSAESLTRLQMLISHELYWQETGSIFGFFANLITAIAGLGLFALRPREREYLWFGSAQVMWALLSLLPLSGTSRPTPYLQEGVAYLLCLEGAKLLNLEFFATLLGQRKRVLYWTAVCSIAVSVLLIFSAGGAWIADPHQTPVTPILEFIYGLCVPMMLLNGVRRGKFEARVLIAPFSLSFLCNVIGPLLTLQPVTARLAAPSLYRHFWNLIAWPIRMTATEAAGDLAMFSVVAVLVLRYARSRRDEERLVAELEAARAVQHVLIPDDIPSVPGFHIECVYKPAGDVGGDFFQILPLPEGGAVIVIGDVSGKGMPAAMTVSMLVGMLRILTGSTQSPAEILAGLNRQMTGRTPGGFVTCLILQISTDGVLRAANAGHVPPYINGSEVRVENGLPLGLVPAAVYAETTFLLALKDQVTLLTDGVVEARAADGELFGFDRAASISAQPASRIAAAAERFGQEDDITVLSLMRQPSAQDAARRLSRSAWTETPA